MILENTKRDVELEGIIDTHKMSISLEAQSHIIKLVTEYAYSQPLESGIRETLSNCLDSVEEAGTNKPVIVSFKQVYGNYELSFKDEGLGLDKESFHKYIMGIGESTKRNNPSLRGGYGAGSKSWLSYSDSYFYTCIKDGVECKFMIFKGEEFPESTLLHEKETTEPNGVTVTVPIKSWNRNSVKEAIEQQCSYFKNVWFDVEGMDNTYQIFETEDFKFNSIDAFDKMHIVLLDVAYPINFSKLGISDIYVPIALRFDDYSVIKPDFTRENIQYNKESIEAIKNKIKQVSEWFVNKYNEEVVEFKTLREAWDSIGQKDRYLTICDKNFNITDLEQFSNVKFNNIKVENIEHIPLDRFKTNYENLVKDYKIIADLKWNGRMRLNNANTWKNRMLTEKTMLINRDINITGWFKEYLKTLPYKVFVKLDFYSKREDLKYFKQILHLQDYPKQDWRKVITEWKAIQKQFISELFEDGTNLHLSKEFLEWKEDNKTKPQYSNYVSKKLNKQKGDITIHHVESMDRGDGYKWDKRVHPLSKIHQDPYKYIVFQEENKDLAKEFHKQLNKFYRYKFVFISKGEIKKLPKTKQFIMFAKIEKNKNVKLFQQIATALMYNREIEKFNTITDNIDGTILESISNSLLKNKDLLERYVQKHRGDYKGDVRAIIEKALSCGDIDLTYDTEFQTLKQFNEKFSFLQFLKCNRYNKQEFVKELNKQLLMRRLHSPEQYGDLFEICLLEPKPSEEVVEESI